MKAASSNSNISKYGFYGAIYLLASLKLTHNVWSDPTSQMNCGCGDPGVFMWFIAWNAHAISSGLNPFSTHAIWFPNGANLLDSNSIFLISLITFPITKLGGPILSFNIALTVSPVATALSMSVLAMRITKNSLASFVGGFIYGFNRLFAPIRGSIMQTFDQVEVDSSHHDREDIVL